MLIWILKDLNYWYFGGDSQLLKQENKCIAVCTYHNDDESSIGKILGDGGF